MKRLLLSSASCALFFLLSPVHAYSNGYTDVDGMFISLSLNKLLSFDALHGRDSFRIENTDNRQQELIAELDPKNPKALHILARSVLDKRKKTILLTIKDPSQKKNVSSLLSFSSKHSQVLQKHLDCLSLLLKELNENPSRKIFVRWNYFTHKPGQPKVWVLKFPESAAINHYYLEDASDNEYDSPASEFENSGS